MNTLTAELRQAASDVREFHGHGNAANLMEQAAAEIETLRGVLVAIRQYPNVDYCAGCRNIAVSDCLSKVAVMRALLAERHET